MKLRGSLRYPERAGNLFVRKAPHQQLKHLPFPRGQRLAGKKLGIKQHAHLIDVGSHNGAGHPDPALQNSLYGVRQFRLPRLVQLHEAVLQPVDRRQVCVAV